jgi:hypothetical protein
MVVSFVSGTFYGKFHQQSSSIVTYLSHRKIIGCLPVTVHQLVVAFDALFNHCRLSWGFLLLEEYVEFNVCSDCEIAIGHNSNAFGVLVSCWVRILEFEDSFMFYHICNIKRSTINNENVGEQRHSCCTGNQLGFFLTQSGADSSQWHSCRNVSSGTTGK